MINEGNTRKVRNFPINVMNIVDHANIINKIKPQRVIGCRSLVNPSSGTVDAIYKNI